MAVYPIVKDKPELVRSALETAVAEYDIVLLNAGSSAGRDDYSSRAVAEVGSADAGMGIYSAAKMYELGFVAVCEGQYDLLIPDYAWDTPMVQALLETLRSDAFKARMESLGGYRVENPGAVRRKY